MTVEHCTADRTNMNRTNKKNVNKFSEKYQLSKNFLPSGYRRHFLHDVFEAKLIIENNFSKHF